MPIADDIAVATNGNITWTGTTATYTVLEFHRFLQDIADDAAAANNDLIDITSLTPSERSTDNIITLLSPYNITDEVAEHLYDGSVSQSGGDVLYSGLRVLGAVNNINTEIQIVQNNAFYDGSTPFWGTQASGGYNGNAAAGILMQIMVKSRTAGADIDGKRARVQIRHWGDTYDFFNVTLGQGVAVAAVSSTPDAQNTTAQGTVTAYTHVTNTEGYQLINLNNGNGAQPYYSQWTYGADTSGDGLKGMWEFIKDVTGNGTAKTIHGMNGELFLGVTHQWAYDTEASGPFVEDEILSWGTGVTAGTGKLLALLDSGTTGTMWIQLLTGVAPTDNLSISGGTSSATCLVNGAVTTRTVPKVFLGSYTGSLIGAFGIGVLPANLRASDSVQDLLGVTQTPPNNVTFSVTSLVSGDRVLVGPESGGTLQYNQLTLNTNLSSGSTTVVTTTAIPADTPASGTIRVQDDTGVYRRTPYTSWTGSTFTLTGTYGFTATQPRNIFISYIDVAAAGASVDFTTIYSSTRALYVRVRDGGVTPIKTFEIPSSLTNTGGSVAAIRTPDN